MKQSKIQIGQPVEELSFIIAPPPHIKSDVSVLKDDVQFLTGEHFADRYSPAQVSLFRYDDKEYFDDIIREVEFKALSFDSFNIFIKDLKYYRQGTSRSIYLDITNKHQVRKIFEKLIKENTKYVPFISIANALSIEPFEKAWPHLENFQYRQDFLCDRITVLARKGVSWTLYKEIMFGW